VVDATENGQATARSIAPDPKITDNLDDVLRNDQIQGVALATPAGTHAELAIRAMQAGKDVFVEKPMALTLEDAEKMKKVAEGTDRILMVGHLLEYHPAVLKLREMISFGRVG
jgi:UDP-2-acetamido-3-amino-2,3-dideoxy-glucuronate N-acetyltransferase